jgi:ribosomal protein S18 acetylase RimI-like enzyme
MEAVDKACVAAGGTTVVLDTALNNVDAQRFYERVGMQKVAVKYVKRSQA